MKVYLDLQKSSEGKIGLSEKTKESAKRERSLYIPLMLMHPDQESDSCDSHTVAQEALAERVSDQVRIVPKEDYYFFFSQDPSIPLTISFPICVPILVAVLTAMVPTTSPTSFCARRRW